MDFYSLTNTYQVALFMLITTVAIKMVVVIFHINKLYGVVIIKKCNKKLLNIQVVPLKKTYIIHISLRSCIFESSKEKNKITGPCKIYNQNFFTVSSCFHTYRVNISSFRNKNKTFYDISHF